MDPPSYSESSATLVTTGTSARRSIQDIRTLILGNATVLKPRKNTEPVELIVAKRKLPQASAEEAARESHYAFLVTRSATDKDIEILLKSKPQDTIEEALEEMLDRSQTLMEEVLLRHGQHSTSTGCCIECTRLMKRDW